MIHAFVLAAGKGKRCKNKLFQEVNGRPVLFYALSAFENHDLISRITVITRKKDIKVLREMIMKYAFKKITAVIHGGKTRQESVEKGLAMLRAPDREAIHPLILIHNGANPFVTEKEITQVIQAAQKYGAAACGHSVPDTIKEVSGNFVKKTLDRNRLIAMQTPQVIRLDWLMEAMAQAKKDKFTGTDDVSLVERIGKKVKIVPADPANIKITYPHDLKSDLHKSLRIGIGEDCHSFSEQKGLILGGIHFPEYKKLKANSDGDVMLHALFNALSSALGQGSLGQTADTMCKKGITDSKKYIESLRKTSEFSIQNISIAIEAKTPKIDQLAPKIKKSLSDILKISQKSIGITATSGENLTSFGKGRGIRCFVAVIMKV